MPMVTNTGAYLIHAGGARLIPTVPGMVEDKWMTHPQMQLLVDNGTVIVDAEAPLVDPPGEETPETNRPLVPPRNERPVVPQPPQVRPTPPVMPSRPVQSPIVTTGRPE